MYERFEELLTLHGITRYKVSKDTGVSETSLSQWKRGVAVPVASNLVKIAKYLGVTVEYFFDVTIENPRVITDPETEKYVASLAERNDLRRLLAVAANSTRYHVEIAIEILEAFNIQADKGAQK